MSYSIQVHGHTHDPEHEKALHREVKAVLSKPEHAAHISTASFNGSHVQDSQLHHAAEAEARAEESEEE